ncbi:hypothetical protein HYPSUDRAFT_54963 [Hypholoma sublateritium FD-334 SS-4]|uniref:Uncharacterized protein n=1 Tax=Hypholoma sublateritium (strain FD-334 SS-4) TaxID=945553 RepID=A0A0D2NTQ1_HYPSF|nr:hypothetical protein HYPSUDRAFT_54963 [Hypholoma sublateritium FD-334 SS-4]
MRWTHQFSTVVFMCLVTLGTSSPIFIRDIQDIWVTSIIQREPVPAPPPIVNSPSFSHHPSTSGRQSGSNDPSTPPGTLGSLPVTPPGGSANLPATPLNHQYDLIHVTPSDSGSPYSHRRTKGQVTNVKAGDLKSKGYRNTALNIAKLGNAEFKAEGNDAGKKKVSVGCQKAIEAHLNHKSNLKMLDKDHNNRMSSQMLI